MALRARLAPPPPAPRDTWPWHTLKSGEIPASAIFGGDRRLAARTYLSTGYGIRRALEARQSGWARFEKIADIIQLPRTKGILVDKQHGTPFLIAGQLFDIRPQVRKWLALEKIAHADRLFAPQESIIVRRSADVGRSTLTCAYHERHLISDHFFRVEPHEKKDKGWIYGFIRSPQGRAMMTGDQYGHIIQHIEFSHLRKLPVPLVDDSTAAAFAGRVSQIVALRNDGHRLALEAEARFTKALGPVKPKQRADGFVVRASDLFSQRRRLEACYHAPQAAAILKLFKRWERLGDVTKRVWWMQRFKRFYGDEGIPYLSADELFAVNPPANKKILVEPEDGHQEYFVRKGWLVMACSGQVYGLNGAVSLMTKHHENTFFSHDLIRILPDDSKIPAGYLLVALTHPVYGRPLLIRAAYGTSIPHLDPGDVADFPVVRLSDAEEVAIAELAEASAKARADADALDRQIAIDAGEIISHFMAGAKS